MDKEYLHNVAKNMVAQPKGILAADESINTIKKRFETIGLENNIQNRHRYRHLLITAQDAIQDYISGIILFDETIRQKDQNNKQFVDIIKQNKAVVGIKVDQGLTAAFNNCEEKNTKGIQGLENRLQEYQKLGAQFAKWRAVFSIGKDIPNKNIPSGNIPSGNIPSEDIIEKNICELTQYAKIAQQTNIVPIIEPEVLMENDQDISKCQEVTKNILSRLFEKIDKQNLFIKGMILKPNMILPGIYCQKRSETREIAEKTCLVLQDVIPHELPGIAFLSGGQKDIEATENLNMINKYLKNPKWKITFSFGRALQSEVIKTWAGKDSNIKIAQSKLAHRAKMNSLATIAKWNMEHENIS